MNAIKPIFGYMHLSYKHTNNLQELSNEIEYTKLNEPKSKEYRRTKNTITS